MTRLYSTLLLAVALVVSMSCSSTSSDEGESGSSGNQSGDGDGDGDSTGDGDGDGDTTGDGDGDTTGDGDGDTTGDGDGDTTTVSDEDDTDPVGDDLTLFFNPMYSAFDGEHEFKLPAIVQGVSGVRWSALPADAVDLEADTTTGGVMIRTRKPGTVKIIARAGVLSGQADLFITDAAPEDWVTGEDRYNNDIMFPDPPDGGYDLPDGGFGDGGYDAGPNGFTIPNDLSCRNCHGSGAEALDVEHTPQQTGGYSDEELIGIFTMGIKPPGAKFHTPFPESIYTRFHTWDATEEEKKGIVTYLRSLEPKSQGMLDFGGLMDAFGN